MVHALPFTHGIVEQDNFRPINGELLVVIDGLKHSLNPGAVPDDLVMVPVDQVLMAIESLENSNGLFFRTEAEVSKGIDRIFIRNP